MSKRKTDNRAKPDKRPAEKIRRRSFLSQLWRYLGLVLGAEIIAVIYFYLAGKGRLKENRTSKKLYTAGPESGFSSGSVTPFRGGRFFLARFDDGGFMAMSLRCTHLGCAVNWNADAKRFVCPCHASSFDIHGNVLNPPAPSALDYYPVIIDNGIVKVDLGRLNKRERFNKTQVSYV